MLRIMPMRYIFIILVCAPHACFGMTFSPAPSQTPPPYLFDQELEKQLIAAQEIMRIVNKKRVVSNPTHSANQKFNPELIHPNPRRGRSPSYCKLVAELNSIGSRSEHSHQ